MTSLPGAGGKHTADSEAIREFVENATAGRKRAPMSEWVNEVLAALARLESAANRTASEPFVMTLEKQGSNRWKAAEAERDEKHRQLEDMHTWGSEWKARAYTAEAALEAAANRTASPTDTLRVAGLILELKNAEAERDAALARVAELEEVVDACDMAINWHDPRIIPTADVPTYEAALRIAREEVEDARAVLGGPE